jgi:hypothetical protein
MIRTMMVVAAVLIPIHEAAAQTFKCTDKAGKVSYTNTPCSQLGLKDAGEVRDLIQVTPAPPASTYQPPSRPAAPSPATAKAGSEGKPPAAGEEEKAPARRCFTTTGAGGKKVTRCNDKPDEPAD